MFDIKLIRENPSGFDEGLKQRDLEPQATLLIEIDKKRRDYLTRVQSLQNRRNVLSSEIGKAKAQQGDASDAIAEVGKLKEEQGELEVKAKVARSELELAMSSIPNLPLEDVPEGSDESSNIEIEKWGKKNIFEFVPKEHFEIGEALGMMDFEIASKMSGSRFCILSGHLARMERALGSFMLDLHVNEHGYTEVSPPALVKDHAVFGTGQLPKFEEDLFKTVNDYWLIPTGEVPLTNLVAGSILQENQLPQRYTAMTLCFRSEAGAAGRDTRGMLRQHQFSKVELVSIVHPNNSGAELERMTECAMEVLKRLNLPFRKVLLSSGDMGFSARKTYDIEAWFPGQSEGMGQYREVSSCSLCGDFQARRVNARYRQKEGKGNQFVHTLNGSGLAVGRTLIALIENYQQVDGSILVPEVLRPYMNGLDVIRGGM